MTEHWLLLNQRMSGKLAENGQKMSRKWTESGWRWHQTLQQKNNISGQTLLAALSLLLAEPATV